MRHKSWHAQASAKLNNHADRNSRTSGAGLSEPLNDGLWEIITMWKIECRKQ